MPKDKRSAVIQLLDLIWENANAAVDHSWERLNHAMYAALKMAVGAGFEWHASDFKHVVENYSSGRWISDSTEWVYTLAVVCGNSSAFKSYEAWANREPFIADDVGLREYSAGGYMHMTGDRQKERLAVGFTFPWRGYTVKVTSFAKDGKSLTACSYKPRAEGEYGDKVEKRFTITRDDIIADRAERKERKEIADKLKGNKDAIEALNKAGVKTQKDFARAPIAKLRKIAERLAA